jgi:hypothetical protein
MRDSKPGQRDRRQLEAATMGLALLLAAFPFQEAHALIRGDAGNRQVHDPGWPAGAAVIFNHPARVAWWEGPPFGGGQWHAEYRGDAKVFNAVLADFAALDVKTKRIRLHDGVGASFWLNPNREPDKQADARIDWIFMIWQPASWEHLRTLPTDLNPTDPADAGTGAPAEIDVFTGGNLRWSDVKVPEGLEVTDLRLEAHGFNQADGIVLEGKVIDLDTKAPVPARMRLERIEPQPTGGYRYVPVSEAAADGQGHWVLKGAPAGWHRIILEADGYVPRVAGYAQYDQPGWHPHDSGLARPGPVSGRVTDDAGQPLEGVEVSIRNVAASDGRSYEAPGSGASRTGADGRFRVEAVPIGRGSVWVHKPGYVRPGLPGPIPLPSEDLHLSMVQATNVRVTVDFTGAERPGGYLVQIEPEGGSTVGSWGGSGNIDADNRITFRDVPPGRYILRGQPNPSRGNQQTQPVTVDLKGGQTTEVTLRAR